MSTFFMFGKYSTDSLKSISSKRTDEAKAVIKKLGGEVKSIHALLGTFDIVIIVDLPSVEGAMKISLALTKLTGISFTTSPAESVETFDKMAS